MQVARDFSPEDRRLRQFRKAAALRLFKLSAKQGLRAPGHGPVSVSAAAMALSTALALLAASVYS